MRLLRYFHKKRLQSLGILLLVLLAGGTTYLASRMTNAKISSAVAGDISDLGYLPVEFPKIQFGFVLDTFHVVEDRVKTNETLADILIPHKVPYAKIDQLARTSEPIFDVRRIRPDRKYMVLATDTSSGPEYFIYEPDVYGYYVYDLRDSVTVSYTERPVETKVREASGLIFTSLWQTMTENGLSYELTARMEDAFAWSIDFYHIQAGDKFKVVFEERSIDGDVVGVGDVKAAYFQNSGTDFYAYYYESENYQGFFDAEGRPMKKAFLKSPVKYSRISSRFNPRRYHPILKRVRPHYGTDYAAPYGTPIYAVANGVVTKASYTSGNGRYVKIKHDEVYQTQYLHMQKFAKGIRPGVHVKQGQVIGYVGSTGLATGPHVCFRFWKHGRQVNHLRENLPPPEPMKEEELPLFFKVRDQFHQQLESVSFLEVEQEKEEKKPYLGLSKND
jgi:murein DD-endopeptidase MepM/ murein hydrolase activator NlpD